MVAFSRTAVFVCVPAVFLPFPILPNCCLRRSKALQRGISSRRHTSLQRLQFVMDIERLSLFANADIVWIWRVRSISIPASDQDGSFIRSDVIEHVMSSHQDSAAYSGIVFRPPEDPPEPDYDPWLAGAHG